MLRRCVSTSRVHFLKIHFGNRMLLVITFTKQTSCGLKTDLPDKGEREFPFPAFFWEYQPPIPVPESREWNFPLAFPSPKIGSGIFFSHSILKNWEWNFPFAFHSRKLGIEFSTCIPVHKNWEWNLPFPKSKSHSRSSLLGS